MWQRINKFAVFFLFVFIHISLSSAGVPDKPLKNTPVENYTQYDKQIRTMVNVNNISSWVQWDGLSGYNPVLSMAGTLYPRGTASVVFTDGIIWGGYVLGPDSLKPKLRLGGQWYVSGTAPGWILDDGTPADPDDPEIRIYRIRRDWMVVSDAVLRREVAEIQNIHLRSVQVSDVDKLRLQYETDWNEWPVEHGAPFYDLNGNGVYEPNQGETPGLQNADQVIWFVCNDLDFGRITHLAGSPPIGIELQGTIWGYNYPNSALDQAIFRRYRIVNKSGFIIDSMFIGQCSDPDIGNPGDDFVGCDTLLQMEYAYNSYSHDTEFDRFHIPPSAAGYTLLQGPFVPSPNSIGQFNFQKRNNHKNLKLTSSIWKHPLGDYERTDYGMTIGYYHELNGFGFTGDSLNIIPYRVGYGIGQGQPTKFPLSGDPVLIKGDVDGLGNNFSPGDRRILLSSGPFTMQPGDTQEVIFALVGGNRLSGDQLTSVKQLKENIAQVRNAFANGFRLPGLPEYSVKTTGENVELDIKVSLKQFPEAISCRINFSAKEGNEPDFYLELYDDGSHGDTLAGDGIWERTAALDPRKYPVQGDFIIETAGEELRFPGLIANLSLRDPPLLNNWRIVWENGKQDGKINTGETVHLAFDISNPVPNPDIDDFQLWRIEYNQRIRVEHLPDQIPSGTMVSSDENYLVLEAPKTGDSLVKDLSVIFDAQYFSQKLVLPIVEWHPNALQGEQIEVQVISGFGEDVLPRIADPTLLTGHTYRITVEKDLERDTLVWKLYDLEVNQYKLQDVIIPLQQESGSPVIDGIEWVLFLEKYKLKAIVETANGLGSIPERYWGVIGVPYRGKNVWHAGSSLNDPNRFSVSCPIKEYELQNLISKNLLFYNHDFEIRFMDQDSSLYFHWYGNDSSEYVPFTAWDVVSAALGDPDDDIRLLPLGGVVGEGFANFAVNTDPFFNNPATDWLYLREPLDRLGSYSVYEQDIVSGALSKNWWDHSTEAIGPIIFCDWGGLELLPEAGTIVRFITAKPLEPGYEFLVTTPSAAPDSFLVKADTYFLYPNYPNPFNSYTTILFYLPNVARVKVAVFNVLGQKVKTLINSKLEKGEYRIRWDGKGENGLNAASGIYFVQMEAANYRKVYKMILVK